MCILYTDLYVSISVVLINAGISEDGRVINESISKATVAL